MLTYVGSALAAVLALAIILMGLRYILDPRPAAAGFGIPGALSDAIHGPAWLAVKAAREISIGIAIGVLLVAGSHRQLGDLMLVISLVPIADGAIVLRSGGPKAAAYGIHWATAAVILIAGVLLIA